MGLSSFVTAGLLALRLFAPAGAVPTTAVQSRADTASSYWVSTIDRQGTAAFGEADYKVFRNVKDYGATGDGTTDDTAAINKAVQDGTRCIKNCDSKTNAPALVYFPPGTYLVSSPIIQTYYTQFVGDAITPPTLKASAGFKGMAVIDSDPYEDDGSNWYINQNNFFRQVRNFVIDITAQPASTGACIHWQVAQATSLQNIVFNMNPDTSSANAQKGIFMDNGSGGFMADLTFNGGGYGAFIGSQQFTTRNMTFNNCNTAIYLNWCWLWNMQNVNINGGNIGIDMSSGGVGNIQPGSLLLLDSKFSQVPIGINTLYQTDSTMTNNTLILDNVDMSDGVTTAIRYGGDNSTLLAGGSKVASFAQGRQYSGSNGKTVQTPQDAIAKPESLMSNGKVFTRSKPQYESVAASTFVSVKSAGAKGDGTTDDTAAIQKILDDNAGGEKIVYFDHGAYMITDTVKVPKNIKITGEMWPLIMASGEKFSDEKNPIPLFQVGEAGDTGDVEMSDLIFETKGPAPGAVLMQYNLAGTSAGSAGLWDVHFRVGGTAGTELQSDKCSKNPNVTTTPDPECYGAFMMFHVTKTASVYVENCWFWVADHELDLEDHNQINIYNGRGVLIESENPVWFWGTASEHSQLYNYQLTNARNTFLGLIQTETAYMQGNPDAKVPFSVNDDFSDPDFSASCTGDSDTCARTWGLRVMNSSEVFVYGGGLYSFFDNYGQDCLDTESCQDNMVSIEDSSVQLFGISTKASVNMITVDGKSVALDKDNRNTFCAAIAKFATSGGSSSASQSGSDSGSGSGSGSGSSYGYGSASSNAETAATPTTAVPVPETTTTALPSDGSSDSDEGSPDDVTTVSILGGTATATGTVTATAEGGGGATVTVTVTATVTAPCSAS
ncbi:pectate lyase superfamily protein-domain-containing protein [Pseudomassariella vexata]|uniref:Pectate lyase superfamily protein-domain-containing protein n=1 Tax=Pseudomassariella vexata TaxID=1141098 RepID=A0A1Y2DVW0_9PEZI|nr:pectate lyase superfamily protein-domain-containing protein [Pseudomassariella vexata]ORY63403.1 pectate lyase superfamily protein-domain-containing protein [Pseudomassariella vexata]